MATTAVDIRDRLRSYLMGEPEALVDPYPLFRDLRDAASVHDLGTIAVLPRYEGVKAVLRDPQNLSSRTFVGERSSEVQRQMTDEQEREAFEYFARFEGESVQHTDGERHAQLRRIASRAFTPRRIEELRESVQQLTDDALDGFQSGDVVDLKSFAFRLPLQVVLRLLDVPLSMLPQIREWSIPIGASRGITSGPKVLRAVGAIREFGEYVNTLVADLRANPRDESLVGALISAEEDERLTIEELQAMLILFLFAGHETTTNLLSTGLVDLLRHPDQWQRLCDDPPATVAITVEEVIRYSNPVQTINRVALDDLEIADSQIRRGQAVVGLLGSANRDPAVFDNPDSLDIGREQPIQHLGLGFGRHFCLGSALARLESQVVFGTLATRFPRMELAVDPDRLEWSGNAMLRSIDALPVVLNP
jgi:cytochrome P450